MDLSCETIITPQTSYSELVTECKEKLNIGPHKKCVLYDSKGAELSDDDIEYLKAKTWSLGNIPNWRSMSNNSVICDRIDRLPQEFWDTYEIGEPYGLINIEQSRKCGRTGETQYPDPNVEIFNPCAEQSLENYETCCLSEVFLPNIKSYDELIEVLKITYRVNKHSLSLPCSLKETEHIVHKNMRMGIGMTGILQATQEQRDWLKDAYLVIREYDKQYSKE